MSARVACLLSFLLFSSESWTRPSSLLSKKAHPQLNLNNSKNKDVFDKNDLGKELFDDGVSILRS